MPDTEVSPERILLGRLALQAREGNMAAVREQLLTYFDKQMPAAVDTCAVRERRLREDSSPLYLAMAELPLATRTVNMLENRLGVLHVIDLDRWRWPDDIAELPMSGPAVLLEIETALRKVGAWDLLWRKKRIFRSDAEGGLLGNRSE